MQIYSNVYYLSNIGQKNKIVYLYKMKFYFLSTQPVLSLQY